MGVYLVYMRFYLRRGSTMSKKVTMTQDQLLHIIYNSKEFKKHGTSISRGTISNIKGTPSTNSIIKILGTTDRYKIKEILELYKPIIKQEIIMLPKEQWVAY